MRLANHLREQGKPGSIINISSIGGLQSHWPGLPYDMTKAALNMMTMSMGIELAEFNIRVNAIAPGAIQTYEKPPNADERWEAFQNRIPIKHTGHPMEIASVAAFLASDDASYMTATVFPVDGGVMAQIYPKGSPI
jgi:meso-butanediol dehydrogenase/(S,S)-butanediol dehydrogenase/diacetyl reductase